MRLFPLLNSMIVSYISKGHMKLKLITFIRLSICVCVVFVRSDMLLYSRFYILPHLRGWYKMSLYVILSACCLATTTRPLTKSYTLYVHHIVPLCFTSTLNILQNCNLLFLAGSMHHVLTLQYVCSMNIFAFFLRILNDCEIGGIG